MTNENEHANENEQPPIKWWTLEEFKARFPRYVFDTIKNIGYNRELASLTSELDRQLDQFTEADFDEMERDWNWNRTLSWDRRDVAECAEDMYGDDPWKVEQTLDWWDAEHERAQRSQR